MHKIYSSYVINSATCFGIRHVPLSGSLHSCFSNAIKCTSVSLWTYSLVVHRTVWKFHDNNCEDWRWHVWCAETCCIVDNVFSALKVGSVN